MDLLYGLAFNLLMKLFLEKPAIQQPGPPPSPVVQTVKVEAPQLVRIPDWVTHTPEHGFVGISCFCQSIEEARQQALHSAIAQIVQTMGAEYSLSHESRTEGDAHSARHELKERLAYTARWFVRSVNESVRQVDIQEIKGKYLCFLLVKFSPDRIEKLRRLSIGHKAGALIIKTMGDHVLIEARENNGVEVTLTDYQMEIITSNQHAGIITLFLCKVPETSRRTLKGVIDKKITLKENATRFTLPCPTPQQGLKSIVLGSENQRHILLHGHDELGRAVSVPVSEL